MVISLRHRHLSILIDVFKRVCHLGQDPFTAINSQFDVQD